MIKKNYFILEESPYHEGKYKISINFDLFPEMTIKGSYNLFAARLMGLSYAQYLRMCRDCFGATIIGKNSLYPVAYFKKKPEVSLLLRTLNMRMSAVIWEREHPDWQKHQEYIKQKTEEKIKQEEEWKKNVSHT